MNMTDSELLVVADGTRLRLRRHWERGETGALSDVYDLALMQVEAGLRALRLAPIHPDGWLTLFDPDNLNPSESNR